MEFLPKDINVFYTLGLIIVILYSNDRFNTPVSNRLSTTSSKYYTGLMMYLSVYIFLYHVIMIVPGLHVMVNKISPELTKLPTGLISALLLTTVLPAIPYVKGFDSSIKNKIHDLVNIPQEVSVLVKTLKNSEYKYTDIELNVAYDELNSYGFSKENMIALTDDSLMRDWVKVTVLKNKMNDCKDCGKYKLFNKIYSKECGRIIDKYDELMPLVLTYYNSSQDGPLKDGDISNKIDKVVNSFLGEIYRLMARAVFSKSTVLGKSNKYLEDLGFVIKERDNRLSWDMISLIFMTVFIVYVTKFIVDGKQSSWAFLLAFQIALSYCIAVFWAVYPKLYWPLAERNNGGLRRTSYYLIATMLTIVSVLIIRTLVIAIKSEDQSKIITGLLENMPWQIPSACLALVLCYYLDGKSVIINRWFEGFIGAVLMCGVYAFTKHVLDADYSNYDFIFPFLVGIMIFSYVPHWYRNSLMPAENVRSLSG